MDPAPAVDAPERDTVTPAFHELGPLPGALVKPEPLRGAHQLAVHHPGGQRIRYARREQHAELVELGEPFVDAAEEDLHACRGRASDDNRRVDPASIT